jgi:hypothetical protein
MPVALLHKQVAGELRTKQKFHKPALWKEFVSHSECERNPLVTRGVVLIRDSETFRRKNSGSETNPMGCPRTPSDLRRNRDFDERARNRKIAVETGQKTKNAERVTLGVLC